MKPIISDGALRDAVIRELADDAEVIATHISVTAVDGAITLEGHVMTHHEKHVAVRAAERVSAVRAVADEIRVTPPSLHQQADDEIAQAIAHLRRGSDIPDAVGVQVRDGTVILHGTVESVSQRDAAESAINGVTGILEVGNLIRVKPRPEETAAEVERRVRNAIVELPDAGAAVHATMTGTTVRLDGRLPSLAALQQVMQAVETVRAVTAVESRVVIAS